MGDLGDLGLMPADELDAVLRDGYAAEWAGLRDAYHAAPGDFYAAWWYLHRHPIALDERGQGAVGDPLDVFVARVNPATGEVDDDDTRNTQTEVWLEFGPVWLREDAPAGFWDDDLEPMEPHAYQETHDPAIDCGAASYEAAVIALARLVHARYGDDRRHVYDTASIDCG